MEFYLCSNCKCIVSTSKNTCLTKGNLLLFQNFPEALLNISHKINVSDLSFDCFCVFNVILCEDCKTELGRFYITKNESLLIGNFTYSLDKNFIEISKYVVEENSIIKSSCGIQKIKKNRTQSDLSNVFELEAEKIKEDKNSPKNRNLIYGDLWKHYINGIIFLREKEIIAISDQFKNMEMKFKKLNKLKDLI